MTESSDPVRLVGVLRDLQDVAARAIGDVDTQLRDVLQLGCRELELPIGVLFEVRGDEAIAFEAVSSRDDPVERGAAFRLADADRSALVDADRPVAFDDSGRAPVRPLDPALAFEVYIGVPIRIGGALFGVLSFGSREPSRRIVRPEEKEIAEALGRHLEAVLGADEHLTSVVRALDEIPPASGPAFFEELASKAAELLEADHVAVCEKLTGDPVRARTHAYWSGGKVESNYEYAVSGTPCAQVMEKGLYHCPEDVQSRFPGDPDLVPLRAESYLGAAITDPRGEVLGLVVTLHTTPTPRSVRRERLIRILAARATAGLARVRMERELGEQRELFELASETGHLGLWGWDLVTDRLELDSNARTMFEIPDTEVDLLDAWRSAMDPHDVERVRELAEAHLGGEDEAYAAEYPRKRPDGSSRWFLARGRAVRDGASARLVGVVFDITEQKAREDERQRLEAKVRQAQRLESLGVLASGLAHDFNDLLMGVLGNAGLARRSVQAGSLVDQKIEEIEIAANRAAELTNQMLAYSGRARVVADSFDLNQMVEEMARLLRTVVSKKAALSLQLGSERLPIEADSAQVHQVVMNLITNASDALADHPGAVTMTTGLRHFDRHFLSEVVPDEDLTEGSYAFLEVVDTGVGMDEETRGRIFDPFFTTKLSGRGLGLAAVLGIMRSHGGGIRVQSAPGEGTRMTVLFPSSEADEAILEGDPGGDEDVWEGQGAVLVVDDEETVRSLMVTVLEDAGFEVLTASDGVQALEVFEANADRVRLILLDMVMPRMNGEEVYTEIRSKNPDTSIILMSGFSEEQATRSISDDDARFLKKPFQITTLLDTVQKLLDS